MWYTYILYSDKSNHFYIGSTGNLEKRLERHNKGVNISTKYGCPWVIVYFEVFNTNAEALLRERKIKSYKGGQAFKNLLNNKHNLAQMAE